MFQASKRKNFEDSSDALEVLVTRDQGGLPGLGEGGGEAIRVGQVVLGFETGGQLAEFHVNAALGAVGGGVLRWRWEGGGRA